MAETKTNIPVEIKMGNAGTNNTNLPAFKEGSIIFTKDTKKIYIDPVGETERIAVGGSEVVVDAELSKTSTNPVQNSVITTALYKRQSKFADIVEMSILDLYQGTTVERIKELRFTDNKNDSDAPIDSVRFYNSSEKPVILHGISAGELDTDAVNVSQLNSKQDKFADIRSDTAYDILRGTKNVLGFANNTEETTTITLTPTNIILQNEATGTEGLSNIFSLTDKVAKFATTSTNSCLPVLGVATPISAADTTLGITADDLDYQAANKKYVDTSIDDRSQFQKLIDEYDLTQRAYVDLTGLSTDRFYYNDFVTCVTDLNNDVTTSSVAKADTNVCVLIPFTYDGKKAYLLQLLAKVEITTVLQITKSTILDINGFELAFVDAGSIGTSTNFYSDAEFMIYGAKLNSIVSSDPQDINNTYTVMLDVCWNHLYVFGGKYIQNITKLNKNNSLYNYFIYDINTSRNIRNVTIYNIDLETQINVDYEQLKLMSPVPDFYCISLASPNAPQTDEKHKINISNSTFNLFCNTTTTYSTCTYNCRKKCYTTNITNTYIKADRTDSATVLSDQDTFGVYGPNITLTNCNIEARRVAASIYVLSYVNGCILKASKALACNQNSYVQNSILYGYSSVHGDGGLGVYVGNCFVDNCTIISLDDTNSLFVKTTAGAKDPVTRLYISNSSFTKPRVDAGQEIYYGEGISQEMRDYTVAGTKHNTTDNYSTYTKENALPVVDLEYNEISRNAQSGIAVKQALDTKQDKFGTVSYESSPRYLNLSINGYVDPNSGKFIQLSPSDITATHIDITNADFLNKVKFNQSLIVGSSAIFGFDFELPTATTPGTIKTSNPNINKLNFSNGLGNSDIQLSGIAAPTADNDAATKKYVDDVVGNINSILATMFNDVSTQSDEEPTNEEVIA